MTAGERALPGAATLARRGRSAFAEARIGLGGQHAAAGDLRVLQRDVAQTRLVYGIGAGNVRALVSRRADRQGASQSGIDLVER